MSTSADICVFTVSVTRDDSVTIFVARVSMMTHYIHRLVVKYWSVFMPNVGIVDISAHISRREQTLCNRLRIGHTYLTHSYLLKDEDPPICITCNSRRRPRAYTDQLCRQNFYTASNLKDLFHNIHPKRIISFIHAIGLTNKL